MLLTVFYLLFFMCFLSVLFFVVSWSSREGKKTGTMWTVYRPLIVESKKKICEIVLLQPVVYNQ